jgi:hypothetical protein
MELMGERGVTGNGHRRRFRSKLEDDWQVGPTRQRGGEREPDTGSGLKKVGRGLVFFSGPVWFPGVQFDFYFFFLLFPFFWISDLSFEKVLSFRFE